MLVRFPDGTVIRALSLAERDPLAAEPDHGLYLDPAWTPDWPAELIDWPDFGLPADSVRAAEQIRRAFERARAGERIEVGCRGGLGRTGTVLACMAMLAGVPAHLAVPWVRENYRSEAVETAAQEAWVGWFADWLARADA
jgi:hypothetical protein